MFQMYGSTRLNHFVLRYVWATADTGMDELNAGWAVEKAEGFQRSDGQGLKLWSKHFAKGPVF